MTTNLILSIINDLSRMNQVLENMDDSIKGVSALRNRLKAVFTTLSSHRYEIPNLLGKSYHAGDNMIGTMELNENLKPGTNRIKRVIKPQVSYQGKMIQAAEVVIEYNE